MNEQSMDKQPEEYLTKEEAEALGVTGDAIINQNWKEHWQNHSDPAVQSHFQTALDFYQQQGYSEEQALDYMKGIDFNHEVSVVTVKPDDAFKQYQTLENNSNGNVGNYFTSLSSEKSELGIQGESLSSQGRVLELYTADKECQALESTAADIEDWKGSGELYYGGSEQYFIPDKGASSSFFSHSDTSNAANSNNDINTSQEQNDSLNNSLEDSSDTSLNSSSNDDISSDLDYQTNSSSNNDISSDLDYQANSSSNNDISSNVTDSIDTNTVSNVSHSGVNDSLDKEW